MSDCLKPATPAEPLEGWKLNHARHGSEEGIAEIGYLDDEDDWFSPIVTVDTGLYYQPAQALPLAISILGAMADSADTIARLRAEVEALRAERDAAVLAERERCASICEQQICACCWDDDAQAAAEHLAAEIRKPDAARKEADRG